MNVFEAFLLFLQLNEAKRTKDVASEMISDVKTQPVSGAKLEHQNSLWLKQWMMLLPSSIKHPPQVAYSHDERRVRKDEG